MERNRRKMLIREAAELVVTLVGIYLILGVVYPQRPSSLITILVTVTIVWIVAAVIRRRRA